ncbi:EutN/CcmL family microcompartment protein [Pontibacillus litoralis]|uniref:Ethanolamine utilization protein EutN n=1 Tax=Pontibacillus litoralis JSM 072002 TaxID=1385512 RepID=A0A0A5G0A9_9BACI|nr:EutN/CcmL family microcompartment protein [Pontibacillus litoralis]KGX84513.1 ethanolamine utilization protein EutN [Pontibacillus litoralis JSM 072002]
MIVGNVVGSVWSTRKHEQLNGLKFLVVSPLYAKDMSSTFVAADIAGAGTGDTVLVTRGSGARAAFNGEVKPVDSVIVGVIDSVEINESFIEGGS